MMSLTKRLHAIRIAHALPWDADGRQVARDVMQEVGLDLPRSLPRRVMCPHCAGLGVREHWSGWLAWEGIEGPRPAEACPRCDGEGSEPYYAPRRLTLEGYAAILKSLYGDRAVMDWPGHDRAGA